jgi:hypothetical protein
LNVQVTGQRDEAKAARESGGKEWRYRHVLEGVQNVLRLLRVS